MCNAGKYSNFYIDKNFYEKYNKKNFYILTFLHFSVILYIALKQIIFLKFKVDLIDNSTQPP